MSCLPTWPYLTSSLHVLSLNPVAEVRIQRAEVLASSHWNLTSWSLVQSVMSSAEYHSCGTLQGEEERSSSCVGKLRIELLCSRPRCCRLCSACEAVQAVQHCAVFPEGFMLFPQVLKPFCAACQTTPPLHDCQDKSLMQHAHGRTSANAWLQTPSMHSIELCPSQR